MDKLNIMSAASASVCCCNDTVDTSDVSYISCWYRYPGEAGELQYHTRWRSVDVDSANVNFRTDADCNAFAICFRVTLVDTQVVVENTDIGKIS